LGHLPRPRDKYDESSGYELYVTDIAASDLDLAKPRAKSGLLGEM